MNNLSHKKCIPCKSSDSPFGKDQIQEYLKYIDPSWKVIDKQYLEKSYKFSDFKSALAFTNKVAQIAEEEGHHPDVYLSWGRVTLKIWTHKIHGLSMNDFILAAKSDQV